MTGKDAQVLRLLRTNLFKTTVEDLQVRAFPLEGRFSVPLS